MPGPGFPTFGSLDDTMANRSPFGSQEKSKTVSKGYGYEFVSTKALQLQTFVLDDFDREILIPHLEDFQITEY
jgi:hypothetical protein